MVEDLPRLQAEEITLATQAQGAAEEIEQISAALQADVVDEQALSFASRIDGLAEPRARHVTAEKDLPDRRLQLKEAELAVAGILSRLGRAKERHPARLILGPSEVGALRDLIETRSGIEASVEAAINELTEARHRLDEAAREAERRGWRCECGAQAGGAGRGAFGRGRGAARQRLCRAPAHR